jgi:hypothetical protein
MTNLKTTKGKENKTFLIFPKRNFRRHFWASPLEKSKRFYLLCLWLFLNLSSVGLGF